jgi:hypothetical protein
MSEFAKGVLAQLPSRGLVIFKVVVRRPKNRGNVHLVVMPQACIEVKAIRACV